MYESVTGDYSILVNYQQLIILEITSVLGDIKSSYVRSILVILSCGMN